MPEDFTLDSLAQALETADSPDEAREPEDDQPEGESGADEHEDGGQEQESAEDEGADAEDGDGEDDQPEKESSQDRVHKWKTADGTEYEVPESDLRAGYMRAQDYTQKTQALSKEREQAESEIQNRATQQLQALNMYGERVGELHMTRAVVASLESALRQTNREDDPARYASLQADILNARSQEKELAGMLGNATQLIQQQQTERIVKGQREAAKTLAAEMPDFKDRLPVWNRHATETYGFSPQELSQVTDPRVFRMLDDATKFRELQNRKPEAVKKAAAAPQKPAKQTRSTPPSTVETVRKNFNARPTVDGLAAMLMATGKV